MRSDCAAWTPCLNVTVFFVCMYALIFLSRHESEPQCLYAGPEMQVPYTLQPCTPGDRTTDEKKKKWMKLWLRADEDSVFWWWHSLYKTYNQRREILGPISAVLWQGKSSKAAEKNPLCALHFQYQPGYSKTFMPAQKQSREVLRFYSRASFPPVHLLLLTKTQWSDL